MFKYLFQSNLDGELSNETEKIENKLTTEFLSLLNALAVLNNCAFEKETIAVSLVGVNYGLFQSLVTYVNYFISKYQLGFDAPKGCLSPDLVMVIKASQGEFRDVINFLVNYVQESLKG